jgi:hypothetical protein
VSKFHWRVKGLNCMFTSKCRNRSRGACPKCDNFLSRFTSLRLPPSSSVACHWRGSLCCFVWFLDRQQMAFTVLVFKLFLNELWMEWWEYNHCNSSCVMYIKGQVSFHLWCHGLVLIYYPRISIEGLRKCMKILSQDWLSPGHVETWNFKIRSRSVNRLAATFSVLGDMHLHYNQYFHSVC